MTDSIRRKHEAQVAYTKEKQGNFPYLFQSIQSNLRISDVDALFAALDEARGKVEETYSLCRAYRKKLMALGEWANNYEGWISNGDSVDIYDMVKEVKQILKGGGDG